MVRAAGEPIPPRRTSCSWAIGDLRLTPSPARPDAPKSLQRKRQCHSWLSPFVPPCQKPLLRLEVIDLNRSHRHRNMDALPHDSVASPSLYSLVFEELCELASKKGESLPSSEWIIFLTRLAPKGLQGNLSPREKKRLGKSRIALMERRCRQAMRKWPRVFQEACEHLQASNDRETVFKQGVSNEANRASVKSVRLESLTYGSPPCPVLFDVGSDCPNPRKGMNGRQQRKQDKGDTHCPDSAGSAPCCTRRERLSPD